MVHIKRTLRGYVLSHECPHCGEALINELDEAGSDDECPECGETFVVPGRDDVDEFKLSQAIDAAAKEQLKEQKDKLREQRLQRKAAMASQETHDTRRSVPPVKRNYVLAAVMVMFILGGVLFSLVGTALILFAPTSSHTIAGFVSYVAAAVLSVGAVLIHVLDATHRKVSAVIAILLSQLNRTAPATEPPRES